MQGAPLNKMLKSACMSSKRQKENIEEEKKQKQNPKSDNNCFFFLLFRKCFVRKHIWKNLVWIVTFVLVFFLRGRLLGMH